MPSEAAIATATILNGASLSDAVLLGVGRAVAIIMPAAWTAAGITFQGSADGSTYQDMFNTTNNEVAETTVAASRTYTLPDDVGKYQYIKIRSGTSGVPVNQAADRAIKVIIKP